MKPQNDENVLYVCFDLSSIIDLIKKTIVPASKKSKYTEQNKPKTMLLLLYTHQFENSKI